MNPIDKAIQSIKEYAQQDDITDILSWLESEKVGLHSYTNSIECSNDFVKSCKENDFYYSEELEEETATEEEAYQYYFEISKDKIEGRREKAWYNSIDRLEALKTIDGSRTVANLDGNDISTFDFVEKWNHYNCDKEEEI